MALVVRARRSTAEIDWVAYVGWRRPERERAANYSGPLVHMYARTVVRWVGPLRWDGSLRDRDLQ